MKILKRKGFIQKIIITLIVLIMSNFIVPCYSMAAEWGNGGSLADPICDFVCWIGDSIINFLQERFLPGTPEIRVKKRAVDVLAKSLSEESSRIIERNRSWLTDEEKKKVDTIISIQNEINSIISEKGEDTSKWTKEEQQKYDTLTSLKKEADEIEKKVSDKMTDEEREKIDKYTLMSHVISYNPDNEWGYTREQNESILTDLSHLGWNTDRLREYRKEQEIFNIFYGPLTIFSNMIPALDVNFINPEVSYSGIKSVIYDVNASNEVYVKSYILNDDKTPQDSKNIAASLQRTIATWYNALRNLAIVLLLSVLIYIAIRIILSSAAGETAKYKAMLKDWLIALCILFFMHYFIAFLLKSTEMVTQFLTTNSGSEVHVDSYMSEMRARVANVSGVDKFAYTVMYVTLVCYTLMFTWRYLKRVVYLAFLTVVSPMVAFTYPIDKIKDGSAQAFNKWFKEYLFNVLIQPVHLLLYTILITSAIDLANTNILYSLVALGFMLEAEKIVKDFFGFQAQRGESTGAAITGGAMFAATVGLVQKGLGFLPEGDGGKGDKSKPRHSSRQKDTAASDRVKKAWGGGSDKEGGNPLNQSYIDSAGGLHLNNELSKMLTDKQKAELFKKAKGLRGMTSAQGANVLNNMVNEMLNGDSQTVTNSIRNTNTSNTNMLNTNTSNTNTSNTSTSNTSDSNVPGNIGQATIQHATIQQATINQGAMQGQSTARTVQTGLQQANAQSGEQISTGGSGSNGGIPQFIKPYEATENENTSTSNSENKNKPSKFKRVLRGAEFMLRDTVNRDRVKKHAKKALRLGLMGAGAATLGTIGLGAGLAGNGTDDVVKYTGMGLGLGAMAGKKGYGLIQEGYHGSKDRWETANEGYYGEDYQDKYYGPKLDKEYKKDPEVIKHYKMYYGENWKEAIEQGIELRKMGITDQDDIDIALQKVRSGENEDLSLEQVASIIGLYKAYSRKDLEDKKYQTIIYKNALSSMTNGNKQAAERIVNAAMKSRNAHGRFVMPKDDEEENS